MITPGDIRNATAAKLKEHTKAKVYKNEVFESFSTPCFFVAAYIDGVTAANKHTVFVEAKVEIAFFASKDGDKRIRDEGEAYETMGALAQLFATKLKVNDRALNITNNSFAWAGENNDIPNFQFSLQYFDDSEPAKEGRGKLIENIIITERVENKNGNAIT